MDKIIEKILAYTLTISENSSLSESFSAESFIEAVLNRLDSFGYEPKEDDSWVIGFVMQKVENHIKNSCNIPSIPEGLFNVAVDMVCGEFLLAKKQTGKLDLADLDMNGAVTQIREGDISVSFGDGSSVEERFNQFLNYLLHHGEGDFVCFRKLTW